TIEGRASNADALIELLRNSRRDCLFFFIISNFNNEYFLLVLRSLGVGVYCQLFENLLNVRCVLLYV
ncbi:MAG TPA: hypothetical protein VJ765_06875, partial [Chitinophagaceae bacterium]|nr:hypothetical protein [Chitinophagaceae bacterium]